MAKKILITGGIKSGKSNFALQLAKELERTVAQLPSLLITTPDPGEKIFIATARPIDKEMEEKIEKHKKERGDGFQTIEEPIRLGETLNEINSSSVIIDCLTLWLSNLFFEVSEMEKVREIESFISTLKEFTGNAIIVTNEVGWGIIPGDEISRGYQAELGSLNQKVAETCDEVYAMISGIALKIK